MHVALALPFDDVHPERIDQIRVIQNTNGLLWNAAAHPRFASEAPGASKSLLGVKGNWSEALDDAVNSGRMVRLFDDEVGSPYTFSRTLSLTRTFTLVQASGDAIPDSFDSATNWPDCAKSIGDIRDQSNCGCCWAFAGAEAGSDRMCIASKGKLLVPLSAQDGEPRVVCARLTATLQCASTPTTMGATGA